jgi:hypothetical protein
MYKVASLPLVVNATPMVAADIGDLFILIMISLLTSSPLL